MLNWINLFYIYSNIIVLPLDVILFNNNINVKVVKYLIQENEIKL